MSSNGSEKKKKEFPSGAFFRYPDGADGSPARPLACIDIGANLMDDAFRDDVDEVLARARDAGVHAIVVTGTSVASSEAALAFASEKSTDALPLYATVGVHPHEAKSCDPETFRHLAYMMMHPKCVACGECGLDFDRNFSPPDVQREVFAKHVDLAKHTKVSVQLENSS